VVGDVKQSIYRWRNSDWEILSEQLETEFGEEQLRKRGLQQNWRSLEKIVRFNNMFFSRSRELLADHFEDLEGVSTGYAEKVEKAYEDVMQVLPENLERLGGAVRVSFLSDPGDGDWKDLSDRELIKHIEELQDAGVRPAETAILVRSRRDGKRIADAILDHKMANPDNGYCYDVISNESLYLYHAPSVRILIGVMRYIVHPEDRLNLAQLIYEYRVFTGRYAGDKLHDLLGEELLESALPADLLDPSLRYLTLMELTERIITLGGLGKRESETPFILGFQDLVMEYCRSGAADIHSFLQWWTDKGDGLSLSISEDQDAFSVMTIHKAKGLEFKAVIIPYCNWSFDHNSPGPEILWCRPAAGPFRRLNLLPLRYGSALAETLFEPEYREEKFRTYMDHLNLLYVAFTRARESLRVFAPAGSKEGLGDVSQLLLQILSEPSPEFRGCWDEVGLTFEYGKIKTTEKTIARTDPLIVSRLSSHEFSGKLRLRYRGTDFFDPQAERRVQEGTLMHEVFSRIRTSGDVGRAVDSIRREGWIDREESADLENEIRRYLETDTVRDWFDGGWRVIAEQDILAPGGVVRRPDRVMIKGKELIVVDYKFGLQKSTSYQAQLRQYADLLHRMDYESVRGFIWYVRLHEIVEVK
jgi:ATP-dependent exoDNAse (exonuclease V) beta subunit